MKKKLFNAWSEAETEIASKNQVSLNEELMGKIVGGNGNGWIKTISGECNKTGNNCNPGYILQETARVIMKLKYNADV